MPELPEVEVIKCELEPLICNKEFAKPILHIAQTVQYPSSSEFISLLEGKKVKTLTRKGKYLIINLNQGYLVVHLRMTGNLTFLGSKDYTGIPYLRAELPFQDGSALAFSDMRRFGRLWLVANTGELNTLVLGKVGPDIFTETDTGSFQKTIQSARKTSIKAFLLDQSRLSGMGNIYTDEALFRCGIHPGCSVQDISTNRAEELFQVIQDVLRDGISFGGTSFRDYRNASGALGSFQNLLKVYGRKGEKCMQCGTPVARMVLAGRGTYYCQNCQRK